MRRARLAPALTLAAGVALAAGCASKVYQGPTSGRAAESQIAVATSAEAAFARFDAARLKGKKVRIEVFGLTERLERESPEEAFVRELLNERILSGGGRLAATADEAEMLVAVSLRAAGVDVIRRDFPLIYNHHTFRALTSARIVAYRLAGKAATGIAFAQDLEAEAIYREIYLFYAIGPIQQREVTERGPPAPKRP